MGKSRSGALRAYIEIRMIIPERQSEESREMCKGALRVVHRIWIVILGKAEQGNVTGKQEGGRMFHVQGKH